MSTSWFIVVFSNGQWWVDHEGKPYGPYASAEEASEGAIRLAQFIRDDVEWEVFAPGEKNRHVLVASRRQHEAVARPRPADAEGDGQPN
jgi:hypothetical protein